MYNICITCIKVLTAAERQTSRTLDIWTRRITTNHSRNLPKGWAHCSLMKYQIILIRNVLAHAIAGTKNAQRIEIRDHKVTLAFNVMGWKCSVKMQRIVLNGSWDGRLVSCDFLEPIAIARVASSASCATTTSSSATTCSTWTTPTSTTASAIGSVLCGL